MAEWTGKLAAKGALLFIRGLKTVADQPKLLREDEIGDEDYGTKIVWDTGRADLSTESVVAIVGKMNEAAMSIDKCNLLFGAAINAKDQVEIIAYGKNSENFAEELSFFEGRIEGILGVPQYSQYRSGQAGAARY